MNKVLTTLSHPVSFLNLLTIYWLTTFDVCHCFYQLAHGGFILELDVFVWLDA